MSVRQTAWLCGIVILLLVGALWWDFSKSDSDFLAHSQPSERNEEPLAQMPLPQDLSEGDLPDDPTLSSAFETGEEDEAEEAADVQFFPSALEELESSRVVLSEGVKNADGDSLGEVPSSTPQKLPTAEDAAPIDDGNAAALREIIEQELPRASAEEWEIWLEELEGLSPRMARELLKLRQRLGPADLKGMAVLPGQPKKEKAVCDPLPTSSGWEGIADGLGLSNTEKLPQFEPALKSLRVARDVVLNNIANASTIGFKRSRVLLKGRSRVEISDEPSKPSGLSSNAGPGVQVTRIQTVFTPGRLYETGSQWDWAIEGKGFFQVESEEGVFYTRAGTFELNSAGEVVLVGIPGSYRLVPSLVMPEEAGDVRVSETGEVSFREAGRDEFQLIGTVELVRFRHPGGLRSEGSQLFAATENSGEPRGVKPGEAGAGRLRQKFVEESNVSLEAELERLKRLQQQIDVLAQVVPQSTGKKSVAEKEPESSVD